MKVLPAVVFSFALLLSPSHLLPQIETHPTQEDLKRFILEKDYPELMEGKPYRARIENILEIDIDNDGRKEFVVHYLPHYRQSASVVVYRSVPTSGIARVTEGLAPGPLQAVSGEFLDAHELGQAVDLSLGPEHACPGKEQSFLQISIKSFGGVVAYRSFYHLDGRRGPAFYVDMKSLELPSGTQNCEAFEFSRVRQIAAGHIQGDSTKNYLAAWVGDEIYLYLIKGISNEGMLDKESWSQKAPATFSGFIPGPGLKYETPSGPVLLSVAK